MLVLKRIMLTKKGVTVTHSFLISVFIKILNLDTRSHFKNATTMIRCLVIIIASNLEGR